MPRGMLGFASRFCARNIFIRTALAFLFTAEPVELAHRTEFQATASRWGKQSPWMLEEDVLELSYLSFILHSYFLPPWRSHGDSLPLPSPYSAVFSQLRSSPSSLSSHPQRPHPSHHPIALLTCATDTTIFTRGTVSSENVGEKGRPSTCPSHREHHENLN